ncbi:MAG: hypothetical protein K6E45_02740 [Bacteroidaceae bacterium]|nr:hypothetical protein [Bacteroidaceae bacterium]
MYKLDYTDEALEGMKRLKQDEPKAFQKLFQHCTMGLPIEYGQIEETISQEVLQDIAQWIKGSIVL